jgi:hypothetical protein
MYLRTKNYNYFFIGILFGLLIIEQSFTTVLITSGVLLVLLTIYFSKEKYAR